ncbi:MAG TPA: hypothetical protein ENH15_05945 [Actinobacteria bacterium]|nr:hypothetical protein [Actinomycetota bacterium]
MKRWTGDRGASGAIEMVLAIGLLMFPLVMLVASIPRWVETLSMAELAAQEAARSVVLSGDQATGEDAGRLRATEIALNHGFDASAIEVTFAGVLDWGQEITATVVVDTPLLVIPGIGEFAANDVVVSHSERVDDFRSFPP